MQELLTAIFCEVDDFSKAFEDYCKTHYLPGTQEKKEFFPETSMALSEIMTIVIVFHLSQYRTFKWYYKNYVCKQFRPYFPKLLSYNRFVELMKISLLPLTVYMIKGRVGKCTGISFIDSTTLDVCDARRIHSHKVFAGIAERGKSSTGWFYGFKLHLVINDCGEILSFHQLFDKGITLVTKIRKNMKNVLMDYTDKILLRKRAVIESVNDFLKNVCPKSLKCDI